MATMLRRVEWGVACLRAHDPLPDAEGRCIVRILQLRQLRQGMAAAHVASMPPLHDGCLCCLQLLSSNMRVSQLASMGGSTCTSCLHVGRPSCKGPA